MQEATKEKLYEYWPYIFVLIILLFITFFSIYSIFIPRTILPPGVSIDVEKGMTLREISEVLEKREVVNSAFYLRLFLLSSQRQVQAGTYQFVGNLNTKDVAQILVHGGKEIALTFFEGMNLEQVKRALAVAGINVELDRENIRSYSARFSFVAEFKNATSLEGFLFPDTYFFFKDATTSEVVEKFLSTFQKKALPLFRQSQSRDYYADLILASMIEKEVQRSTDKALVSDILRRRLAVGMKLDVDATVVYITKNTTPTRADLQIDSPYNTYRYGGLPPTPIANPGLASIEAVFSPKANEFWFYLSDKDGNTHYAKTLDEHLDNRLKYLGR